MRAITSVLAGLLALAWASPGAGQPAAASTTPRSVLLIRYQDGKTSEIRMDPTPAAPRVQGKAKVKANRGNAAIDFEMNDLPRASTLGPAYVTYVLWAVRPEGRAANLGELPWKGKPKMHVTVPVQQFGLIVTAEPYAAVTEPSPRVVAENRLKEGETVASTREGTYQGDDGSLYASRPNADIYDPKTPIPILEARLAVEMAERAGASMYASNELAQAQQTLGQAEAVYAHKPKDESSWGNLARETTRLASTARTDAVTGRAQAALEEERRAHATATEQARTEAEAARAAAAAQTTQAEEARRAAERAEQQAASAQQQAEEARAAQKEAYDQASAAMRQAEQASQERDEVRQQLERSLSAILETRREARGLVVNVGDVLFDFGKSTLQPGAREKLSRLAGVLLAYPSPYTIAFEGHTDSVGSDEYNQKLSEARAEAVRDYLVGAGVPSNRVVGTRGLGKASPIASNDTDAGRQLNRRVEIVINDETKAGAEN